MSHPDDKQHTYYSERWGGRKEREIGTKKEKWGDRVYTLRNHIIHGNKVHPKEYMFEGKQSHVEIGMLFFIFLMRKQLDKSLGSNRFSWDEITWEQYIEPGFQDEENVDDFRHEGFVYEKHEIARMLSRRRRSPGRRTRV